LAGKLRAKEVQKFEQELLGDTQLQIVFKGSIGSDLLPVNELSKRVNKALRADQEYMYLCCGVIALKHINVRKQCSNISSHTVRSILSNRGGPHKSLQFRLIQRYCQVAF
jgi:hypothetical protein